MSALIPSHTAVSRHSELFLCFATIQDQLSKLERVLESDEARSLLGEQATQLEDATAAMLGSPSTPARRSQRQADRETRETAEKIRAENRATEVAGRTGARGRGGAKMRGGGGARARPRRQIRPPAKLEEGAEQEVSLPLMSLSSK